MKVQIRYFASIREAIGHGAEDWDTEAATLGQLRAELLARGGVYAEVLAPGRALRMALEIDPRAAGQIPSTKGTLQG